MNILCFGDSNTYGYIPGHYEKAPARYPWGIRWTSLLNEKLGKEDYRVIEELPSFPMNCGKAAVDWIRSVFSWKAMPLWICSS